MNVYYPRCKQFRARGKEGNLHIGSEVSRLSTSMNSVATTKRNSTHPWDRVFCLAVALLALSMAGQAVLAKASHYSGKSTQSVYFSSSVKIANLAHNYSAAPEHQAIAPVVFSMRDPRPSCHESNPDSHPSKLSRPMTSRLLRSP